MLRRNAYHRRIGLRPTGWLLALVCALALALAPAGALASSDPLRVHQWGLDVIQADAAHATSSGGGAVVAVVDTGVMTNHPDLAGRVLPGYDFVASSASQHDGNGHGTHVSGIIAADADNGIGIEGVAPSASILPVRVLGDDGSGSDTQVAEGVNYATDHGADVINLSLGGLPLSAIGQSDLGDAINRALDRGVVVVAAAGNDTLPLCEQPGTNGRLLCVGSTDRRGAHSFFSSFGLGVNVFAPGGSALPGTDEDIVSTYNDGGYRYLAGTSQATPHVSGVAALLVSLGLHGSAVVQRIRATETPAGMLDARAAVAGLQPPPGPAPPPATVAAPSPPRPAPVPAHHRAHRRRHHRAGVRSRRVHRHRLAVARPHVRRR